MYIYLLVWLVPFVFIPVILEGRKREQALRVRAQDALEQNDLRGIIDSTRELAIMLLPKKGFGKNEVPVESPPEDDARFFKYFHERFVPRRQASVETLQKIMPLTLITAPFVAIIFIAYVLIADLSLAYLAILLPPVIVIGFLCYYMLIEALENMRTLQQKLQSIDERLAGLMGRA